MNAAADILAQATVEVDLGPIELGQRITVSWRGQPVFIDHRTSEQIAQARVDDGADLPDPEQDSARAIRPEWLVVIGICTHLGCVPLGQKVADPRGGWGGRSEEHTSELQSLMRISYAGFCLKKKNKK